MVIDIDLDRPWEYIQRLANQLADSDFTARRDICRDIAVVLQQIRIATIAYWGETAYGLGNECILLLHEIEDEIPWAIECLLPTTYAWIQSLRAYLGNTPINETKPLFGWRCWPSREVFYMAAYQTYQRLADEEEREDAFPIPMGIPLLTPQGFMEIETYLKEKGFIV